jgi:hypothetical protein
MTTDHSFQARTRVGLQMLGVQLVELLPQRIERNFNRGTCDYKLIDWLPAALAAVKGLAAHGVDDPDAGNAHGTIIVQPLLVTGDAVLR